MDNSINICHVENFLWTPVRTKPRCEKKLAEFCGPRNIVCYLPLRKSVRRYKRRSVEFFIPMFSGYVFCLLDHDKLQELVFCNAFAHRIAMNECSEKIMIDELNSIQIIEKSQEFTTVTIRPEIVSGAKILIKNGPFKGMAGIVERRKDSTIISINIEILGQSATTVIDVEDVEVDK